MSLTTPDNIRTLQRKLYLQGKGGAELPVLSALRQGLSRGHPAPCLQFGARQQRCTGRGWRGLRGNRGGRARELAERHREGPTIEIVSAPAGATGDDSQARRR